MRNHPKEKKKRHFPVVIWKKRNGEEGKQQIPILMAVTLSPQALRMRPILLAVTPFPSPLTTPPVTKTYFIFIFSPLLPHFRITKETDNLPFLEYLPSKNNHNDKKKKSNSWTNFSNKEIMYISIMPVLHAPEYKYTNPKKTRKKKPKETKP